MATTTTTPMIIPTMAPNASCLLPDPEYESDILVPIDGLSDNVIVGRSVTVVVGRIVDVAIRVVVIVAGSEGNVADVDAGILCVVVETMDRVGITPRTTLEKRDSSRMAGQTAESRYCRCISAKI